MAGLAGGKCYYLAGNFAAAEKLLAQIVAAGGPSLGEAAHWLVRSLLKEGKPAEAAARPNGCCRSWQVARRRPR